MNKNKYIIPLMLILLSSLFCACGNKKSADKNEEKKEEVLADDIVELRDDQIKLAGIETGKIELRSMNGILKVNGIVTSTPQNTASVSMPMGGFVRNCTLMPGCRVNKGQTLAIIENPDFIDMQQAYLETRNKLEFIGADYNRQKELFKNDVASAKNMQQVTAEFRNLKIQLKALEQKLQLIGISPARLTMETISRTVKLSAPIAGYVKTANVSIGKAVAATDVLFEIINENNLIVQLSLFEKDVDQVHQNQKIRFTLNNETEEHSALVYQTAQAVDADKTYKVYAKIQHACRRLVPGMYVNAQIEASSKLVTSVPSEAIVSYENKDYIFVFGKNKTEDGRKFTEYKMIAVRKGVSNGAYTEIILPNHMQYQHHQLVTKGAYNLLSAKKNAGEMAC